MIIKELKELRNAVWTLEKLDMLLPLITLGLNVESALCLGRSLPEITLPGAPLVSLEHININTGPWNEKLDNFYFHSLGCARDPRAREVHERTKCSGGSDKGLVWANIGLQQIHLPVAEKSQVLRGIVGLVYSSLVDVKKRLRSNGFSYIAYKNDFEDVIEVSCPAGNRFRLHQYFETNISWLGPAKIIQPPNEYMPENYIIALPGGFSSGLGMEYIQFDVPPSSAFRIALFYEHFFHASVKITSTVEEDQEGNFCNIPMDNGESCPSTPRLQQCIVTIGFNQRLIFSETLSDIPEYDGHHIAIYVNDFADIYERIQAQNLNWDNPRFPQFSYATLEAALTHNEFRVKDMVDPSSGEIIYELEHEIRYRRWSVIDALLSNLIRTSTSVDSVTLIWLVVFLNSLIGSVSICCCYSYPKFQTFIAIISHSWLRYKT